MSLASDAPEQSSFFETSSRKWQYLLDKSSPHILPRWIAFTVVFSIYFVRVWLVNGWFIVTYGLGIYLLNQFIGFLSPQFDPEESDADISLPTRETEEFRYKRSPSLFPFPKPSSPRCSFDLTLHAPYPSPQSLHNRIPLTCHTSHIALFLNTRSTEQAVRAAPARVQVLVFVHSRGGHVLLHDLLLHLRCARVLAHLAHLLSGAVLHNNEAAN